MISHKEQAATTKKWLSRGLGTNNYIKALERRKEAFTFANITKYENGGVGKGDPKENTTESHMIEYSEICRLIEENKKKIEKTNAETLAMVENLESQLEKAVIIDRYINSLSWDDIGKRIGYSSSHIQRIHGRALLSLYVILRSEGKE